MQAGGKSTGKKTLSPEDKTKLAQRIARDAHAQLQQQNPAPTGNRNPGTPPVTAPTIPPPVLATPPVQAGGPFGTWLAAQPGPPPISKGELSRYMTSVVNPKVQTVVGGGSQYDYVKDIHKAVVAAYQELPKGADAGSLQQFATDHVDNLVETVDSILETVGTMERKAQTREAQSASAQAESARIAMLAGDGGYPVGTIEGSGESTTMVILNRVIPEKTGTRYVVWLQHHQNKHQARNSKIPELGVWGGHTGTTFLIGQDLAWHKKNTATWVLQWLQTNQGRLSPDGTNFMPDKTDTVDNGVTYDLTAWIENGMVVGSYHCNPEK